MHVEPPGQSSTFISPLLLRDRIQKAYPWLSINAMPLIAEADRAVKFSLRGAIDLNTGKLAALVHSVYHQSLILTLNLVHERTYETLKSDQGKLPTSP